MAENTTPAMCSEAVYQAACAAGVLIVTTAEEAAIQKFADAIQTAAYAEGRADAEATVRDGFAAAALQALLARINTVSGDYVTNAEPLDAARDSYKYADAMLMARQA